MRPYSLCAIVFGLTVGFSSLSYQLKAQGCSGLDTFSGIGGGVTSAQPGQICANVDALALNSTYGFGIKIDLNNVAPGDIGNITVDIDWGDGTTTTGISGFTLVNAALGSYEKTDVPKHFFPVTGADVSCSYTVSATLRFNGTICGTLGGFGSSPTVNRWNIEGENSSAFAVTETNTGDTVFEVCAGATTTVTFTDRTTLNCVPPALAIANANARRRWREFVYGGAGALHTITGGVTVGVTPVPINTGLSGGVLSYNLTSGAPLGTGGGDDLPSADPTFITPPEVSETLSITVPPTAQVGEEFVITTRYWNFCNRYDQAGTTPAEYNLTRIRVVAQPTPPTGSTQTVCKGTVPNAFSVSGVPGGATVNFYRNSNGVPGTLLRSSTSTTLPINDYDPSATDSLQTNIAGYYKVWVSYIPNVAGATNCETEKVPATIIIRQQITQPALINGPLEVCADGITIYGFNETADSPTFSQGAPTPASQVNNVGGPTQYNWSFSSSTGIDINPPPAVGPSGSTNKQFDALFTPAIFGAGPSLLRVLRVNSTYTSGLTCASTNRTHNVTIYKVSTGGIISPATGDICSGSTKDFELTGTVTGNVVRWEFSTDGGFTFNTDPDFGTLANPPAKVFTNPVNPPVTYIYRAIVQNGPCSEVASATATFSVYPIPPKPTISASPGVVICNDGSSLTLTSSNDNAIGTVFVWYKLPDETNPVLQTDLTDQLVLNTVSQSGDYKVEVRGPTPLSCGSTISDPITVTINPLPEVVSVTGGGAECDGNPAPDIIFEFSGGTSYNFTIDRPGLLGDIVETNWPTNTYTLSGQTEAGSYSITALSNAVTGCVATVLGGSATVSSAGGVPVFDAPRVFTPIEACDDGASTTNPTLNFSLQTPVAGDFILTYKIDALANRTMNFQVDGSGTPLAPLEFTDTELDVAGAHLFTLVSIETPAGCFFAFNEPFNFTVNPKPFAATGAVNGTACSNPDVGVQISVDDPGPNLEIEWSTGGPALASFVAAVPVAGTETGSANRFFTSNSSATATFFAFVRNTTTSCLSDTGIPVTQTQDIAPTVSNAGLDQDNCTGNFTLAANVPNVANGEVGTWTVPGILYQQSFTGYANGTTTSAAVNGWSRDVSAPNALAGGTGAFSVQAGQFVVNNADGNTTGGAEVVWTSQMIMGAFTNVNISIDLASSGGLDASDYINVFYSIDGGAEIPLTNGNQSGDITVPTATATGLSGTTSIQLIVRANNNAAAEFYRFDNIRIAQAIAPVLSDANVFNASITGIPEGTTETLTWSISTLYGQCAPATSTVNVTRNSLPVITNPTNSLCEDIFGAGFTNDVDLNDYSVAITGVAGPYATGGTPNILESATMRIEWFTNIARTLQVSDATNFDGVTDGFILYNIVTNIATGCSTNGQITFNVESKPTANNQTYFFCPDAPPGNGAASTTATIDLTTIALTDIYGSDPGADRQVSYHNTLVDAQNGVNPIVTTITVTTGAPVRTVFARVLNTVNGCVNTSELTLNFQNPPVNNQIRDALNNLLVDGLSGTAPFTGSRSLCASGSLVLFQINPGANPGATYSWNIPAPSYIVPAGDPDNPGTNPQPEFEVLSGLNNYFVILKFPYSTISPPGGRTSNFAAGIPITVTETLGGSCDGNPLTLTVNVDASPPQPVVTGPLEVCENGMATYTISSGIGVTSTWTIPPGATIINSPTDPTINVQMGTFDGQISVTSSSGTGCVSAPSVPLAIDIIPRPTFTFTANPLCSGANVSTAVTLTPSIPLPFNNADVRFNWEVINVAGAITNVNVGDVATGVTSINQTPLNTSGVAGTIIYRVTPVGIAPTSCAGNPQNISVTVNPEPVLTLANKTLCSGESANYEIKMSPLALPTNTTFSWAAPVMSDGSSQGSASSTLSGASGTIHINTAFVNTSSSSITATFTISAVSPLGCASSQAVAARQVVFTINPEPVGAAITRAAQCSDVAFSVSSENISNGLGGTTFTWIRNPLPPGLTAVVSGSGTGPIAETLQNLTGGVLNATYTVTPRSAAGCDGSPYIITVPVNPEPVGVPITRAAQCSDVAFSVSADNIQNGLGPTSTYTWVRNPLPAGLVFVVAGTGTGPIAETLQNLTSVTLNATYTVTPRSASGCDGNTYVVTVPVNPEPVGSNLVYPAQCSDAAFSLSAENISNGLGSTSTFTWVRSPLPPGLTEIVAGTGNGAIAETLQNLTSGQLNAMYTVTPRSATGCDGNTYVITVPINPEPVGANITRAAQCSDAGFSLSADNIFNGLGPTSTYTWVRNPLPAGLTEVVAGTGSGTIAETLQNLTGGQLNATYTVTPRSAAGCDGNTYVITVPVNPEPVGANITRAAQCSDVGYSLSADNISNSLGPASTYSWVRNPLPAGLTVVVAGTGTGPIAETLQNLTGGLLNATYTVTPRSADGCDGDTYIITVPVNPEPVGADITQTAQCSDVAFSVSANNISNGLGGSSTFTWVRNPLPGGLTVVVAGTGSGAIAETLQNLTASQLNATYTVTPRSSAGCDGNTYIVTVPINPEPVGINVTRAAQCSDVAFSLSADNISNGIGNTSTYAWVRNPLPAGLTVTTSGTGSGPIAETLQNLTNAQLDATYTVTPTSNLGCVGGTYLVTVPINPEPVAPSVTTIERCSGENINFDLQTIVDGVGGNALASEFTYTVTASSLAGLSPLVFPGVFDRNSPSNAIINQSFTNLSNTPITITYTVTPLSDPEGCEGTAFELRVIYYPQPVGIDFTDPVCSTSLNHDIQTKQINAIGGNALPSVFTYTVSSSDEAAVPTPAALDRITASNLPITDSFTNSSGADVTITYTIVPFRQASPNCQGAPIFYRVVISPKPVGFDFTAPAVCSNSPFDFDPQDVIDDIGNGGNGVPSTFTWTANYGTPGNLTVNGAAPPSSDTDLDGHVNGFLTNKTNGQKVAVFTVTPRSGTCVGNTFEIRVPVDPQPVLDPTVINSPICSDTPFDFDLASTAGTVTHSSYDITLNAVHPDLIPAPGNRFFLAPGSPSFRSGEAGNAIRNEAYTNSSRTIGLMVEYSVVANSEVTPGLVCQGENLLVQIEILPEPVMDPLLATRTICSDVASDIQLETDGISVSGSSFFINTITLQSNGSVIAPGSTVGSVTSKASNAAADASLATGARGKMHIRSDQFTVINNVAAGDRTVVYNVTPRSGAGCLGNPMDINLQVLPKPEFDYTVPPPVCSDESVQLELRHRVSPPATTNSADIAQYNVTSIAFQSGLSPGGSNIAIGQILTADANGDFIAVNDSYTNGTAASLTATYSITPVAVTTLGLACEGDAVNAVITIKPSPVVLSNLDKIVCNDAINGINIGTEVTSAPAQSFEVVRNALPAGLSPGVFAPGTQVVNGASTSNISTDHVINSTDNPVAFTYTIRANTDPAGAGCYGPAEIVTVTVEPQIVADLSGPPGNANNAKPQICSADDTAITLVSPSNPSSGNVTFNFTTTPAVAGVISGLSPGANLNEGDIIEQVLSNASNNPVAVTYTVTPRANSAAGGNGCVGNSATTIVSVEPKPRMTFTPASLTICEGVPLGIDFNTTSRPSTGESSVFYQLTGVEDPNTLAAPANVSGFVTTYPANYNSGTDALNDILVNSGIDQHALRYLFTPSFTIPSGTCTGDPVSINITVSPRPTLLPFAIDPKCSGEAFSVDYSASVTEVDLSSTLATWSFAYSTPPGSLVGASNGAGFELSQVVFNKTPDPGTVTYSIKAKSFTCESNTVQVPVQIYPTPRITGVPSSVNVCNGGLLNTAFNSNSANTLYTWVVDDESQPTLTGASDQTSPVTGPLNFTLNNTSTVLSNYTFEITPQVNTSLAGKVCVGDPFTMVANVAPAVDGRITTSNGTNESFICTGSREFLFLEFDGLPLFDVVYKEGTNTITLAKQGAFKPIQITPSATTVYELVSVKDAFGCLVNINETATVNVNNTDATFAIVSPEEACSPNKVSFQYNQQQGVNYTWKWFDGPDSTTYTAINDEIGKIVKHTFENPSPVGVAKFKVYLETSLADSRYPGCMKTTFHEVRVSPNIGLGVFPDATEICSGETVAFTNSSQGVTTHRWFYREQGTTQENDVRTTVSPSYQLVNNTTQNPIVYEVVYHADNGKCPTSTVMPITVYRGVSAEFNEGTIPPFVAGSTTVTFTNTSSPLENSQFSYEWTFGGNANPEEFSGANTTIPVTYTLPGLKEVTLTVTNTVANASGLQCSDTFSKTIEILLPPLIAAFNATPLAGCFPVDIEITENTSTGDVYKWQVIDQSGNIAATALAPKPIFRIANPGTYDIFLETSNSITGQTAFAQKTGIEVFDNPIASLEARPSTLFIPDTELITFNFSTGANFYQWDFDDGTTSEDFEPKHFYGLEGTYHVTLVAGNNHGERDIDGDGIMDGEVICYDTARRDIVARQGGLTKIPNAFTPNPNGPSGGVDAGNGTFNDVFLPITKGVAREDGAFVMQIYDRWGTLMYESRNQNQGWDGYDRNGNLVPAGVYVFKLDLRLADGQRITQVGDVTVIR